MVFNTVYLLDHLKSKLLTLGTMIQNGTFRQNTWHGVAGGCYQWIRKKKTQAVTVPIWSEL